MPVTADTPEAMLVEEIQRQAIALLASGVQVQTVLPTSRDVGTSEQTGIGGKHPSIQDLVGDGVAQVEYDEDSTARETNESSLVSYRFNIILGFRQNDMVQAGRVLAAWARRLRQSLLGDAASDRSPLRTRPLPLSGHTLDGVVFEIEISTGRARPGITGEGALKAYRTMSVTVIVHEASSA